MTELKFYRIMAMSDSNRCFFLFIYLNNSPMINRKFNNYKKKSIPLKAFCI